ncbi:MAG: hypothetical protein N2652_11730 [Kiritimatiellae bacterium]|nr:hypothetical protein [Kiritimatiellia bacterium]
MPELTNATDVPRVNTPLLDAIGRDIQDFRQNLLGLPESDRPAKVIFVVVTHGKENASREFREEQILAMIQARSAKDGWQLVFLSADLEAIEDAGAVGFQAGKLFLFKKDAQGSMKTWNWFSENTSAYRSGRKTKFDVNALPSFGGAAGQ